MGSALGHPAHDTGCNIGRRACVTQDAPTSHPWDMRGRCPPTPSPGHGCSEGTVEQEARPATLAAFCFDLPLASSSSCRQGWRERREREKRWQTDSPTWCTRGPQPQGCRDRTGYPHLSTRRLSDRLEAQPRAVSGTWFWVHLDPIVPEPGSASATSPCEILGEPFGTSVSSSEKQKQYALF